jgi:hypothetical protein
MSLKGQPRSGDLSARARAFSVSSLIGSSLHSDESAKVDESSPLDCHLKSKNDVKSTSAQIAAAELLCRELWLEFHALGTEMIITKAGR